MSRFRKVLGEDGVATTATGYRLDVDVDASCSSGDRSGRTPSRTVALDGAALERVRGRTVGGGMVARLTEVHASTSEQVVAAMIADSKWSDAVALLEAHVAVYHFATAREAC